MKRYLQIFLSFASLCCGCVSYAQIVPLINNFGPKLASAVATTEFHQGYFAGQRMWYFLGLPLPIANENTSASNPLTNGGFRGMPWQSGFGGHITLLQSSVHGTGTNVAGNVGTIQFGIYETVSQGNIYPGRLVWATNGPARDGTSNYTVSVTIRPNKLYWTIVHTDCTNLNWGSPSSSSGIGGILGRTDPSVSGVGTTGIHWTNVYQTLPAYFGNQTNGVTLETTMSRTVPLAVAFE